MKRAIIHLTEIFTLFILFVFISSFIRCTTQAQDRKSTLMDTYQGTTVTISGKVVFPAYEQNYQVKIVVETLPTETENSTLVAIEDLPQPGDYSVEVPKNQGDIYLKVGLLVPAEQSPTGYRPVKKFARADRYLKVGSFNIRGVDFTIKEGERSTPLMDTYQGPTVTISGKVVFSDYKQDQLIKMIIETSPPGAEESVLVAREDLPQPGDYSVEVPKNQGDIYLKIRVMEPAEEDPTGYRPVVKFARLDRYLKVGSFNIRGVDFTIRQIKK
jgi:hypothetical protein